MNGIAYFKELTNCFESKLDIKSKYRRLRNLLEAICKQLTAKDSIQFSNFFSRLNYVCRELNLPASKTYLLQTFRYHSQQVLHHQFEPGEAQVLQDIKSIGYAIEHFYQVPFPPSLLEGLPEVDIFEPSRKIKGKKLPLVRVEVIEILDEIIYALDKDGLSDEALCISLQRDEYAKNFQQLIWKGAQLNLVDVTVDEDSVYYPEMLILEPNYLVDISSLAECCKEYGSHPLYYIQGRLSAVPNNKHILLGHAANLFLDEFVTAEPGGNVDYADAMKKVFKSLPFEFSTCDDLLLPEKSHDFFKETKQQFLNIQRIVNKSFSEHRINREEGLLEPSFICEQLGIQGRLDYLQVGGKKQDSFVIELKSGRAPFPADDYSLIGMNHRSQAFLYQVAIQKILGVPYKNLYTYILYSKYGQEAANMRLIRPFMANIKEILHLRNEIVSYEHSIVQAADSSHAVSRLLDQVTASNMILPQFLPGKFVQQYIVPQLKEFQAPLQLASPLAKAYFNAFYAFVCREQYLGKAGDPQYDTHRGVSSLWEAAFDDKMELGEILIDLQIMEHQAASGQPYLVLSIPAIDGESLQNFRTGDIVILYQRNQPSDSVANKQIFKAAIEWVQPGKIKLRLRSRQHNLSVLPLDSFYAVEHDYIDVSYQHMFRGLYQFLKANRDRASLILGQRQAMMDHERPLKIPFHHSEAITEVVRKAVQANDYFLIVGPPGTGKTSIALRHLISELLADEEEQILLVAYTNRAVDEICASLDCIDSQPGYIRVGSSLSCDPQFQPRLLHQVIAGCQNREEVRNCIKQHRLFVGTVASIAGKMDLFKLKHFHHLVVDEASQVLEPQLLGILTAKDAEHHNAIDKIIMIGDHKQLPAVVLQNDGQAKIKDEKLHACGLTSLNKSLFERWLLMESSKMENRCFAQLTVQGRMHPEIAAFPNRAFYGGALQLVPTQHQIAQLPYLQVPGNNPLASILAKERLMMFASHEQKNAKSNKIHEEEARIVASLVREFYLLYQHNNLSFNPAKTIGIITPYRAQIALIKRHIHSLDIAVLNDIVVDTVERFQGSQRDIILYATCVNQGYQMDYLANMLEGSDPDQVVDRKLNVAITRAKQQLVIIGNPGVLCQHMVYKAFINHIKDKGYFSDFNSVEGSALKTPA